MRQFLAIVQSKKKRGFTVYENFNKIRDNVVGKVNFFRMVGRLREDKL